MNYQVKPNRIPDTEGNMRFVTSPEMAKRTCGGKGYTLVGYGVLGSGTTPCSDCGHFHSRNKPSKDINSAEERRKG